MEVGNGSQFIWWNPWTLLFSVIDFIGFSSAASMGISLPSLVNEISSGVGGTSMELDDMLKLTFKLLSRIRGSL